ncbi:acetyl-CoA carboxylase biotin carboxyl carrier protein subunit [Propionivibrio limicola]|uniref:acetyl-CoA carboxylase biotin carboxyl carrier protein subunit n=1 Tax=Propionivibrio limicola TaxID=167645 RepID=UPI001291475D|nr:acetyl-CoA carboxylase biotin carboxyl carrier protein subunit [Propionivibrio limicola]
MKMLKITLEGKTYEVGVEVVEGGVAPVAAPVQAAPAVAVAAPVAAPAPAPAPAPVAAAAGGQSVISPMPGVVMKVRVAVGQQVAKDEEVIILEAMKMESPICAPCAGTVASIQVKEGDAVTEGQILIQLS